MDYFGLNRASRRVVLLHSARAYVSDVLSCLLVDKYCYVLP